MEHNDTLNFLTWIHKSEGGSVQLQIFLLRRLEQSIQIHVWQIVSFPILLQCFLVRPVYLTRDPSRLLANDAELAPRLAQG